MKTVKTLFMFMLVVLIGIALGGCDKAQQMVAPPVAGGGEDTPTPPVETPTPEVEPPADGGEETVPPITETEDGGGEDTTTDGGGEDTPTPPVETPTPEAPPADSGEETVPPMTTDGGGEDTTTDGGDADTTTPPVETPPVVPAGPAVIIMPASVTSPAVGEQLTVAIQVAGVENVLGYEFTLMFNAAALRYVSSENGDYLPGAFFNDTHTDNQLALTAAAGTAGATASGTLATVTFEVVSRQASTLTLANVGLSDDLGVTSEPHVVNAEISE